MNKFILIGIGIVIVAIVGIYGYTQLSTVSGYRTEIYGELDLDEWTILSNSNTVPKQDYSILPESSNNDGIPILNTNEVIVIVQINDKTYEQYVGNKENLTDNTNYNVIINHLPKGEYDYTIFLYRTTGVVMKSRILEDEVKGQLVI